MQISEKRALKLKSAPAWALLPCALAEAPLPAAPAPRTHLCTLGLLPTVPPSRQRGGEGSKGSVKSPFTVRAGTEHTCPALVIPVPCSSWNFNASLIAAATESSVIKRIRKHLYCDHACCQQCILKQNMKMAFMFHLQKFTLRYHVLLYVRNVVSHTFVYSQPCNLLFHKLHLRKIYF